MAKSHIADGALFKDPAINDGKVHPIMHMTLNVLGVNLNIAVWPKETSGRGTVYWPVTGDYSLKETKRLVDVTPVMNASVDTSGAATAAAAAPIVREPVDATAQDGDNLPF